jgi:hypothetical protein
VRAGALACTHAGAQPVNGDTRGDVRM